MLVRLLLLFIFLLFFFLYGGAKLYVKIEKSEYKYIFWGLYAVTIITVLEIIFCIHLYTTYRTKDGELGPRGYQGDPGPDGDKGKCDRSNDNCKKDLLAIMIKNIIEKHLKDKNDPRRLTSDELIHIYEQTETETDNYINRIKQKDLKNIHNKMVEYVDGNPIPANLNDDTYIQNLLSVSIPLSEI